jgi:hypothetical protein
MRTLGFIDAKQQVLVYIVVIILVNNPGLMTSRPVLIYQIFLAPVCGVLFLHTEEARCDGDGWANTLVK